MQSMIKRTDYLDFLFRFKDKQIIKVISGIRRCGKSTLLEQYQQSLLDNGVVNSQIIWINFEDITFEKMLQYKELYNHISNRLLPDKMNYIILDEIQHVSEYQKAVDSLFIKKNTDIYITGSNAYFMSGELATLLSGRYVELKMLPLSFSEFLQGKQDESTIQRKYAEYLENSSFPYTLAYNNDKKAISEYLRSILDTVVLKDVVARYKIADVMMLESVIRFVFDNIGCIFSASRIAGSMNSAGRKIDVKTVEKYLKALTESLIIYEAKRYNIKGKQYLKTLQKYYIVDIGLRYALLGAKNSDVGYMLENVIYLELLRRDYDVFIGQTDNYEVDFVAANQNGLEYYQVAASTRDPQTLNRELRALQSIPDNYPKYILTLDEDPAADYDGIYKMNALEWLINK